MSIRRATFVLVLVALATSASCCSGGAGVRGLMDTSQALGFFFGVGAWFLTGWSWLSAIARRRGYGWPIEMTLVALANPGLYMSPYTGDCGFGRESFGMLFLGLASLLFGAQAVAEVRWQLRSPESRPKVLLSEACDHRSELVPPNP